jgi:DNA-binding NarL/FixJ family response regulator
MTAPALPAGKVLFVDDEPNVLEAFQRQFRKRFNLDIAVGPEQGLEFLKTCGPYTVIVSDLSMPGMNGIQLLAEAKSLCPDTVRIMLTGQADTAAAIGAVNQGNIFRFLLKPCVVEVLGKTIEAAMEQHRLVTAEHVLLEQTLRGAIEVLTEILSLSSPAVFSQTSRLREIVGHVARRLQCHDTWKFEVAAMLSHIGCITVPPEISTKIAASEALTEAEQRIYDAHPQIGHSLLARIPRLEDVAQMVAQQHALCENSEEIVDPDTALMGARMLKVAIDLDVQLMAGVPQQEAVDKMRARGGYNRTVLYALEDLDVRPLGKDARDLFVRDLVAGMIVDQDVMAVNGLLLLARGQEVTFSVIARLAGFRDTQGIIEPVRVLTAGATESA